MYNPLAYELGAAPSCIRDLAAYGDQRANIVGKENVFDFSIGNPSIPAPKEVNDTVRQLLDEMDSMALHGYTPAVGSYETRQAIADDLNNRYQADVSAGDLFLGCGAAPELTAVLGALCYPGARVLVNAPYFPEYKFYIEGAQAEFAVVPADVPHFQIRLDKLEEMLTPNTAAIILNSPNNPAGTVCSRETLESLAKLLHRKNEEYGHPIYVISDEPYRELVYDGVEVPFVPNIYPHTIVCYSYSKSLSLPGERIGYILVPKQAADSKDIYAAVCGAARAQGHICAPTMWQHVIARCTHLRPNLQAYDENRKALYEGLVAAGYEVAKPQGAFYLFVKAPGGDAKAFSKKAMTKDILIVPGDDFGCPDYLRLCYCVSHDKILRSLPLFKQLIEE